MTVNMWEDLEGECDWSLLLGNGFSVNIDRNFSYTNLLDEAKDNLTLEESEMFDKFKTSNFEEILRHFRSSRSVAQIYGKKIFARHLKNAEDSVRNALIESVKEIHPSFRLLNDFRTITSVSNELENFEEIFTTNYDLIPYWALMENTNLFKDFFWGTSNSFDGFNIDISPSKIPIYYIHGALHLYEDNNNNTRKVVSSMGSDLLGRIYGKIRSGGMPLFISEGSSVNKMKKIKQSEYLNFCYKALRNSTENLVIFGHSFSENYDQHIIDAINKGKKRNIAVSLFTPFIEDIRQEKLRVKSLLSKHNVRFFESSSHPLGSDALCPWDY